MSFELPKLVAAVLISVDNPYEPPMKQRDIRRVCEALTIAIEALTQNAEEDYRGNRSLASIRSFKAIKKIEELAK